MLWSVAFAAKWLNKGVQERKKERKLGEHSGAISGLKYLIEYRVAHNYMSGSILS